MQNNLKRLEKNQILKEYYLIQHFCKLLLRFINIILNEFHVDQNSN